ncbi:hypothetical protein K438DRAFT_1786890 [Mycena galopus ATCC 62051]|nr:hypothetical protein K438DRAFT_1786890 [Mycena galopus ATCC 62051]
MVFSVDETLARNLSPVSLKWRTKILCRAERSATQAREHDRRVHLLEHPWADLGTGGGEQYVNPYTGERAQSRSQRVASIEYQSSGPAGGAAPASSYMDPYTSAFEIHGRTGTRSGAFVELYGFVLGRVAVLRCNIAVGGCATETGGNSPNVLAVYAVSCFLPEADGPWMTLLRMFRNALQAHGQRTSLIIVFCPDAVKAPERFFECLLEAADWKTPYVKAATKPAEIDIMPVFVRSQEGSRAADGPWLGHLIAHFALETGEPLLLRTTMGIEGFWKIALRASQEMSFKALNAFEGIAAIQELWLWGLTPTVFYHPRHAQAGRSPELRTLFYKLVALHDAGAIVVFVFDGPDRPSIKRNKKVKAQPHWLGKSSKN